MVIIQHRSKRSSTGARYISARKKKLYEAGGLPIHTKLEKKKSKAVRTKGNNSKTKLLSDNFVNLCDPKTKKVEKVKINNVVENPANRHFVRRNILTKGTIVDTEKGKAKITSRPGQEGTINAVLV